MKVKDIYNFLDVLFPFSSACEWDNSGLLVGNKNATVTKVIIALDCTDSVINEAEATGAELIITHHPVIFPEVNSVLTDSLLHRLISNNISVISAHTNLDKGKGGVNDCLAKTLVLQNIETIKADNDFCIKIGNTEKAFTPDEFAKYVGDKLGIVPRYCIGNKNVEKVAVCGGSGGDFLGAAINAGADAYVSADIKHHVFLDAAHQGITLIDCGHFATEDTVIEPLKALLQNNFPEITFISNHFSVIR